MSGAWEGVDRRLKRGETLLLDGAIGTELDRRGVAMRPNLWCADAALVDFATLVDVHRDYIAAGADIITTNTYAASPLLLNGSELEDRFETLVARSVEAAHLARKALEREDVIIAGSLSHMVGSFDQTQLATPSQAEMVDAFGCLADRLRAEGVDLILMEMMYLPDRIGAVYEAARATGLPIWLGLSARTNEGGELLSFAQDRDIPFEHLLDLASVWPLDAVGVMHSKAEVIGPALRELAARFDAPLYAYPDSGRLKGAEWDFRDTLSPEDLVDVARGWKGLGAQVFGGCCGLTPEHVHALRALI